MKKMKGNLTVMILVVLLFIALSCSQSKSLSVPEITEEQPSRIVVRTPSDIEGIDFIITYDKVFANQDYVAEVFSSVPLTDTYAVERRVDSGSVFLVFENMRQVEEYVIPNEDISAVVQIRYDMDVYDNTDVVLTQENVVMVHTTTSNAGIFTRNDVYILPYPETGFEYISLLNGLETEHEQQFDILYAALLFYYRTVVPLYR
jgi:hypothetical protein